MPKNAYQARFYNLREEIKPADIGTAVEGGRKGSNNKGHFVVCKILVQYLQTTVYGNALPQEKDFLWESPRKFPTY